MKKRPVEKRFDVCDEHGEVLAFSVHADICRKTFGLWLVQVACARVGDVMRPTLSAYRFVRVQ